MQPFEIEQYEHNLRLDKWCKNRFPHTPFGLLQKALRKGMIKVDGKKIEHSHNLQTGEIVTVADSLVYGSDVATAQKPKSHSKLNRPSINPRLLDEIRDWVVFEDAHCIAINKPAGIAVQGGTGLSDCIDMRLEGLIHEDGQDRPRLVHRLDRDTSGILILGKSKIAAAELTAAFRHKNAQKIYYALVMGMPEQPVGTIELPLAKRNTKGGIEKMSVVIDGEGDEAITHYRIIATNERYDISWLECMPITGRTHQLRVHLQAIGHPVYGDGKYGGRNAFHERIDLPKQLHLHSQHLRLNQLNLPNIRKYKFTAPLPPHFVESLGKLGFDSRDNGTSLLDVF